MRGPAGRLEGDQQLRVEVQEFAYWVICAYWNILEEYGPSDVGPSSSEWRIPNRAALEASLPSACRLIEDTVVKVLTCPSAEVLAHLGTIGYTLE